MDQDLYKIIAAALSVPAVDAGFIFGDELDLGLAVEAIEAQYDCVLIDEDMTGLATAGDLVAIAVRKIGA